MRIWVAGRLLYEGEYDESIIIHYRRCYPANNLQIELSPKEDTKRA